MKYRHSLQLEMDLATQNLDEDVSISNTAITLGKSINPTIFPSNKSINSWTDRVL